MVRATKVQRTPTRVRVVVTCTHRKTRPVPKGLRLSSITSIRTSTRLDRWIRKLGDSTMPATSAFCLYAGEHWDVVRQLSSNSSNRAVELWVCSAGYGLVPAEAPLRPYSATFSAGNADSVPDGAVAWWTALSSWEGPHGGPRSLTQLVADDPTARTILVLSPPYLRACRDDILEAAEALADRKSLSIISAGTKGDLELGEFLLPVDARLQHLLGGTRQALNIRVAEHLLAGGTTTHNRMYASLTRLLAEQPAIPRYERRVVTDAQVSAFIRRRARADGNTTHTRLLREFRDSGYACEQARFASLFMEEMKMTR